MFGLLFWKRCDEVSYQFQPVGFHGDRYLLALVDDLVTREGIERFIETGTNVGSTLVYLAKRHPQVCAPSCEQHREAWGRARDNAHGLTNVEIHHLPWRAFLKRLARRSELFGKRCLFWLDAHGYGFDWPPKDELRFIADKFATPYVMIDDFKVPGLDCFGYDEYQGQVCSYDYIRAALGPRPHQLFGPLYADRRTPAHHPLVVGWGPVVLRTEYAVPPARQGLQTELELLSIDVDGEDHRIWRASSRLKPRVVAIKNNPTTPPELELVQFEGEYFGASARAMVSPAHAKGYKSQWAEEWGNLDGSFGFINMQFAALEREPNANWRELLRFPNRAVL